MEELIKLVKNISKKPEVKRVVDLRIREFRSKRTESANDIFKELVSVYLLQTSMQKGL